MTILLVEDEKSVSACLKRRLEVIGADVDVAFTWEQSVEMMRLKQYDIVSLDILLPDSGIGDAASRIDFIRGIMPDSKVIVVSGIDPDRLSKLARENNTSYVAKADAVIGVALYHEIQDAIAGQKGFEENVALLQKVCRTIT